jgi:PPOX class probable F420-dependent enzyme
MGSHSLSRTDPRVRDFWTERHLCTVTFLKPDGRPHVVPMGVVLSEEADAAWAITSATSFKARLLAEPSPVAICQVDGARWATIQGIATIRADEASVADAVRRYSSRYRQPRPNPDRVAIHVAIEAILGRVS